MRKCEAGSEEPPEPARETWWGRLFTTYSKHSCDRFNCSCDVWMAHPGGTAWEEGQWERQAGPRDPAQHFYCSAAFSSEQGPTTATSDYRTEKTKSILACSAQMAPGKAQSGVAASLPQVTARPDGEQTQVISAAPLRGSAGSMSAESSPVSLGQKERKISAPAQPFRWPARLRNMAWDREMKS